MRLQSVKHQAGDLAENPDEHQAKHLASVKLVDRFKGTALAARFTTCTASTRSPGDNGGIALYVERTGCKSKREIQRS